MAAIKVSVLPSISPHAASFGMQAVTRPNALGAKPGIVSAPEGLGRLDAHSYAHLPSALNTLYRLAQLPQAVLVSLIAEGTIHAGLTMSEAQALLAKYKPQRNGHHRRPQVKRRIYLFREFLLTTLPDWTVEGRALVQSELQELLEHISAPMKSSHLSQNWRPFVQP